ncbi:MAG: hypothetical protein IKQ61_06695 [Spirochaetales bacterium]|nr:hypothetical protein [Spirochaetales bacterium]
MIGCPISQQAQNTANIDDTTSTTNPEPTPAVYPDTMTAADKAAINGVTVSETDIQQNRAAVKTIISVLNKYKNETAVSDILTKLTQIADNTTDMTADMAVIFSEELPQYHEKSDEVAALYHNEKLNAESAETSFIEYRDTTHDNAVKAYNNAVTSWLTGEEYMAVNNYILSIISDVRSNWLLDETHDVTFDDLINAAIEAKVTAGLTSLYETFVATTNTVNEKYEAACAAIEAYNDCGEVQEKNIVIYTEADLARIHPTINEIEKIECVKIAVPEGTTQVDIVELNRLYRMARERMFDRSQAERTGWIPYDNIFQMDKVSYAEYPDTVTGFLLDLSRDIPNDNYVNDDPNSGLCKDVYGANGNIMNAISPAVREVYSRDSYVSYMLHTQMTSGLTEADQTRVDDVVPGVRLITSLTEPDGSQLYQQAFILDGTTNAMNFEIKLPNKYNLTCAYKGGIIKGDNVNNVTGLDDLRNVTFKGDLYKPSIAGIYDTFIAGKEHDNLPTMEIGHVTARSRDIEAAHISGGYPDLKNRANLYGSKIDKIIEQYYTQNSAEKISIDSINSWTFDAKEYLNGNTMYSGNDYNNNAYLLNVNAALLIGDIANVDVTGDVSSARAEDSFTQMANVRFESDFIGHEFGGNYSGSFGRTNAFGVIEILGRAPAWLPNGENYKLVLGAGSIDNDSPAVIDLARSYELDASALTDSQINRTEGDGPYYIRTTSNWWPGAKRIDGNQAIDHSSGYVYGPYYLNSEKFENCGNTGTDPRTLKDQAD